MSWRVRIHVSPQFQFQQDQFRAICALRARLRQVVSIPTGSIQGGVAPPPAGGGIKFQFQQDQFRAAYSFPKLPSVLVSIPTGSIQGPKSLRTHSKKPSFNSNRINSGGTGRPFRPLRALVSIPTGSIQGFWPTYCAGTTQTVSIPTGSIQGSCIFGIISNWPRFQFQQDQFRAKLSRTA